MIDLEAKRLAEVQAILQKHVPNYKVSAFGSRVTGKSSKFSDLDLVVEGQAELDLKTIVELKDAFRESNLPFKVDVVDWQAVSNGFQRRIRQECITIQERKKND